jgi:endonuclease/exonuclease/phosphatase (EEP) superfamily protein YafD
MLVALAIATLALVFVTVLPLWRNDAWWVRVLDFPRLQFCMLSIALLVLELIALDIAQPIKGFLAGISLICLLYHSWWIVPYSRLFPVEVKSAAHADRRKTIRIITANVLTTNRNAQELLARVRETEPDVLVTLESDAWWQEQLDTLEEDYPYTLKCPLDNLYGMHVYSRLPLLDSEICYLVEPDIPSMHTLVKLPSGVKVRVHFVHPTPPAPPENDASTQRDAELQMIARSIAETDEPVIVTGDLNDVAWSETTRLFRKISGLLDPRVGRGMFNSFHAGYWFMRWPLDHIFHSHHFTLVCMRRLKRFGSDHFAILTELAYDTARSKPENGLKPDQDDKRLAKEKMDAEAASHHDVPKPGG